MREFPTEEFTSGTIYGPAMEIEDQAEANAWFEQIVQFIMDDRTDNCDRAKAEDIARQNLGYFSGYYGIETQRRVERLFGACHPIFGPTQGGRNLTPKQACELGGKMAEGKLDEALSELDARPRLSVDFRSFKAGDRVEIVATVESAMTKEEVLTLLREGGFNVEEVE